MKNSLYDLNNHLFAQLERLGDEDITGDKLNEEIKRAEAMNDTAQQIISNTGMMLKAQSMLYEYGMTGSKDEKKIPSQLRQFFLEQ